MTAGEARRNAVAEAVAAALKRPIEGGSAEGDAKRPATSATGGSKLGGMMALPFAAEMEGDDSDDDEDDTDE